ncbi:hypothetical protein MKD49_05415 [Herbaspirillum sp. WGmk3]|uniref:hypothetical protein n=1 Tax=Herbaspirillum sp. WGmk3 TaxID=2919925 RepID=UPI00209098D1|nr:hypothetical protein [Herbaspirillum sp. WGmk3]MCO4855920.1 hypothetical protein [Herbaspirillum sp. WGmk3]
MTSVDSINQLAGLIRGQVAALRRPASQSRRTPTGARPHAKDAQHQDIASLVAKRVNVIDANDPQRERKAFKIFLESVLIAELGDELANDPAFYVMVEQVQRQMESDESLAVSIRKACRILLGEKI